MTTTILADVLQGVTLSNGVLRIRLAMVVGDNQVQESGILLLPANQAGPIINQMANSLKNISEKIQEQQTLNLAEEAGAAFESEHDKDESDDASIDEDDKTTDSE